MECKLDKMQEILDTLNRLWCDSDNTENLITVLKYSINYFVMYNIKMKQNQNTILNMEFNSDTDDSDYETEDEDNESGDEYIDALLHVMLLRLQLTTFLEVDQ